MSEQDRIITQIKKIAHDVATQDGRWTSEPMYCVVSASDQYRTVDGVRSYSVFFTNCCARRFITMQGHELKTPAVYVASGYENPEWRIMRELLLKIHAGEIELKGKLSGWQESTFGWRYYVDGSLHGTVYKKGGVWCGRDSFGECFDGDDGFHYVEEAKQYYMDLFVEEEASK